MGVRSGDHFSNEQERSNSSNELEQGAEKILKMSRSGKQRNSSNEWERGAEEIPQMSGIRE